MNWNVRIQRESLRTMGTATVACNTITASTVAKVKNSFIWIRVKRLASPTRHWKHFKRMRSNRISSVSNNHLNRPAKNRCVCRWQMEMVHRIIASIRWVWCHRRYDRNRCPWTKQIIRWRISCNRRHVRHCPINCHKSSISRRNCRRSKSSSSNNNSIRLKHHIIQFSTNQLPMHRIRPKPVN